jgi:hypothetical protein
VVLFLRRNGHSVSCETRLNPDGPDSQLVVTQDAGKHAEPFEIVAALL